ncbi:MAG: hypothetical protein HY815_04750 [Candidatus Riflebacteria bacterium]|nr:hypothetical protein [Candidatus Riflebacteria bacterium]
MDRRDDRHLRPATPPITHYSASPTPPARLLDGWDPTAHPGQRSPHVPATPERSFKRIGGPICYTDDGTTGLEPDARRAMNPKQGAPKDGWDGLFETQIPFKHQIHVLLYHLPGIFLALVIGVVVNVILEEILKRISRKLSESTYLTFVWVGLVIYLIFFTTFDTWVAAKIHWYKIVPYPR